MKNRRSDINKKNHQCIPVLSFFTGGGFLDIGFTRAGFTTVWTNENNGTFADMYEHGMSALGKSYVKHKIMSKISDRCSIEDISARSIMRVAFPEGQPKLFGIIGGPPCPDFSNGGKHKGHKGDHGRLSKIYVERICLIKPAFFVFENVLGLLRTKRHKAFLKRQENKFRKAGYCVDRAVLNALDLGLAQDRERIFVIGIKENLVKLYLKRDLKKTEEGWFPWPNRKPYHNAKSRFSWPTIVQRDITPEMPTDIPKKLMVTSLLSNISNKLPNSQEGFQPYSAKFQSVCEGDTTGKSFKRLHRYRYSPTACYGNNEVHLHPWEDRRLTVREAMRIQGIPDAYVLPEDKSLTAKYKMIANGVPVTLAYSVALQLYRLITDPSLQKGNK